MKKLGLLVLAMMLGATIGTAQKYYTKTGKITFESKAPMEKIEAANNSVTSVLSTTTGAIQFAVLIKAFQFEKALMQEHFNENYMESSKYPKAVFKGKITDLEAVNFKKDGTYEVDVKGKLTMHGVTNPLETKGKITVKAGKISATAIFYAALADYEIEIPSVVKDNIAEKVKVAVTANYQLLKQKS